MNSQSPEVYEEVLEKYRYWMKLRPERKEKLETWIDWWDKRKKCWSNVSLFHSYSLRNCLVTLDIIVIKGSL